MIKTKLRRIRRPKKLPISLGILREMQVYRDSVLHKVLLAALWTQVAEDRDLVTMQGNKEQYIEYIRLLRQTNVKKALKREELAQYKLDL